MDASWVSLVPPLIVIGVVCVTQRLNVSLVIGILSAALIATNAHILAALHLCFVKGIMHFSEMDNIYLYLLLIIISSLITLLTVTGSATGCARIIGKKMQTKRSVETSSIVLSFILSLDDYLSILTVGFVMRPIADRLAVARTKLAYIVHALAGPLVILMPLSTWAAAVLAQLENAGVHSGVTGKIIADPFFVYLKTIPFIFYSLILVVSVWFVVRRRISFGILRDYEQKAEPILYDEDNDISLNTHHNHSLIELFLPIALLINGVFFGMLYAGGYHVLGGQRSFVDAFAHNNQTFLILFMSGLVAFFSSVIISLYKKMINVVQLPHVIYEGFMLIKSSIIMVILASLLGSFLRLELQTGSYVAYLLLGSAPLYLIPVILFIVSLIITLVTGSAWGTFSLLIPIALQMLISFLQLQPPVVLSQIPILFPALGALLSGAACGNHISPFAETTIMTATSTGIEPLEHARTQYAYAIPVIIGSLAAFVLSGLLCNNGLYISFFASFGVGLVVCLGLLSLGDRLLRE